MNEELLVEIASKVMRALGISPIENRKDLKTVVNAISSTIHESITEKQHDQIENMSMLIRRLVFVARRAGTQSKVPEQALDYLKRQGLIDDNGFLRQENDQ